MSSEPRLSDGHTLKTLLFLNTTQTEQGLPGAEMEFLCFLFFFFGFIGGEKK